MKEETYSSVGRSIQLALEKSGKRQTEVAYLTGIPKSVLSDVVRGLRLLTPEMAVLLEPVLGLDSQELMSLQCSDQLFRARSEASVVRRLEAINEWEHVKNAVSMSLLKKRGLVSNKNVEKTLESVYDLFGVDGIGDFVEMEEKEDGNAYYRQSPALRSEKSVLLTWKYLCFRDAESVPVSRQFDKDKIGDLLLEANRILLENSNTLVRLRRCFGDYGVRLMQVEKADRTHVDGLSFWRDDNPTIALTLRYGTIDNLAFTLMHELGHVVCHLSPGDSGRLSVEGAATDDIEKQADGFASDAFIAADKWNAFMEELRSKNVSPYVVYKWIDKLAEMVSVNPQILFGRYMHETGMYKLKRMFPTTIK